MSSENRDPSPTPSEREKLDAADRKREEEEQAKLPYKWTQTLTEADVTIPIAGNLKSRDLVVEIKKTHLKVSIKGGMTIFDMTTTAGASTHVTVDVVGLVEGVDYFFA